MATIEQNAVIKSKDTSGNLLLIYPVTKSDNIAEFPDIATGATGDLLEYNGSTFSFSTRPNVVISDTQPTGQHTNDTWIQITETVTNYT